MDLIKYARFLCLVTVFFFLLETVPNEVSAAEKNAKPLKKAAKPLKKAAYQPPLRGAPSSRVGGGSRGAKRTFTLRVIAPDHTGLTISDQPTLYWYASGNVTDPVEFTLTQEDVIEPIIEVVIVAPTKAGIQKVGLADFDISLNSNVEYQWFISVVKDREQRSRDIVAGATIKLIDIKAPLQEQLRKAPDLEHPLIYANAGVWYDAVASLGNQIAKRGKASGLREQRALLMDQVELAEVSTYDRSVATN